MAREDFPFAATGAIARTATNIRSGGRTPIAGVIHAGVLLAIVLAVTGLLGRWFGFSRPDRIALVFCGSKKSLATGVPMAQVLFAGGSIGLLILPLMLFHQIQLMVCAVLAQRYARRPEQEAVDGQTASRI